MKTNPHVIILSLLLFVRLSVAEPIKTPTTPLEVLSEQVEKKFEEIDKTFQEIEKEDRKSNSNVQKTTSKAVAPSPSNNNSLEELNEEIRVSRETIKAKAGDKVLFQNNARTVPFYRDGIAIGLRLFAIPPDSLCKELSLQTGDVIQEVDGEKIADPTKFNSVAYERLSSPNPTIFLVLRNSLHQRIRLTIFKD